MLNLSDRDFNVAMINMIQYVVEKGNVYRWACPVEIWKIYKKANRMLKIKIHDIREEEFVHSVQHRAQPKKNH